MSKLGLLLFLLFSCQVMSDSLWLQETAGTPGLPVPHHLQVCPSACPLSQWCHPTFCHPLFLPSIFPESGSFPVSQLFASGGKSTVVSASVSVLSMNTQDWFPLGWTGGSPCSPKDSQGSSQHHSSKAPVLHSAFFIVKLSMHTWPLGRSWPWLYGPLSAKRSLYFLIRHLL